MKMDASHEQHFIDDVEDVEFVAQDIERPLHALIDQLAQLDVGLQRNRLGVDGLKETGALAQQAQAINASLETLAEHWPRQWREKQAAQELAEEFSNKAMLLVFGKFNAGKSSLCNFLADRFAAHGKRVQYFQLENGRIALTAARLKERSTEATAQLQGVQLGENLVLLDTPGLHSMTSEHAALTQRFTDSADGMLWLTSSPSPGQVQELDELARELHRNKPLLPVVTRSDVYEEDEVDGALVKFLRNKTPQNRAQQEADIRVRAQQKLSAMGVERSLLKTPVSISVHVAREQGQTQPAMNEAGFERLFAALLEIIAPALAYKQRKPAEVLLHHVQENVFGSLHTEILPQLDALARSLQSHLDALLQRADDLAQAVWRSVLPALPAMLEKYASTRGAQAVRDTLSQSLCEAFKGAETASLSEFAVSLDESSAQITTEAGVGYEDIESVGVDYVKLHAALEKQLHVTLEGLVTAAIGQCRDAIVSLQHRVSLLSDLIRDQEHILQGLNVRLRSRAPRRVSSVTAPSMAAVSRALGRPET